MKDSFKLFADIFNTQKTQSSKTEDLFREMLCMKDDRINDLNNQLNTGVLDDNQNVNLSGDDSSWVKML